MITPLRHRTLGLWVDPAAIRPPFSMIEELRTASSLLSAALERYLAACSAILDCYEPTNKFKDISQVALDLILDELEPIASYEAKFKQAKSIINQARNIIPVIAPINALPPDILSHIFRLVLNAQPTYFEDRYQLRPFPVKHPETLTYVCSRWRQIAIDSRILWSRIDVVTSQCDMHGRRLLARAEVFAARADPLALDIHIIGHRGAAHSSPDIDLNAFCASIATRTRSLNLLVCYYLTGAHLSCLQIFFANCIPGILNRLVIADGFGATRIEASESRTDPGSQLLDIPHMCLEELLTPINVLELTGVYFHWASHAYHGLVELRLMNTYTRPRITGLELRGILAGSPRLRVLHLQLEIVDLLPNNVPHTAVVLDYLEVLDICGVNPEQYEILSRVLSSGPKPLQLSVRCDAQTPPIFGDRFARYVARSNVTELSIEAVGEHSPPLFEALRSLHIPNLRVLSLCGFCFESDQMTLHSLQGGGSHALPFSQLDALHLRLCRIVVGDLQRVAEAAPLRMLTISSCSINLGNDEYILADKDRHVLVEMAPVVQFLP